MANAERQLVQRALLDGLVLGRAAQPYVARVAQKDIVCRQRMECRAEAPWAMGARAA